MRLEKSRLPATLPPLREELQLHAAAANADGSPAWIIQDPVSNSFVRIGWLEFELLLRWALADSAAILEATARETLLQPTEDELEALYLFLLENQLLAIQDINVLRSRFEAYRQSKLSRIRWLLHHYLFFRIPLIHPADTLHRLLHWLNWIFTPACALSVVGLGILGLVLTARQWDVFSSSFTETMTPAGFGGYLIALAVAKSLHELGHALTATRYGLRVAHMGVAFVVMWPMLYTDTGESWRLSDSRQRLKIASAGIITEIALAALATLAWNLCGDGDVRQALFFLATTAWIISLGINASPFMRFDGYFILSDLLDIPNLHERAFAQARTAMRNTLLGWKDPAPEVFSAGRRRGLIAFAFGVWLYRLTVFVGIALAVYFYFFKLLGIFLFAVEIAWFVVLPIWRELQVWRRRQAEISAYRKRLATAVLATLALLAMLPWSYQVRGEGYAHPGQIHTFFSPLPARIQALPISGLVAAGQSLFILDQPEQAFKAQIAAVAADSIDLQLRGLAALPDGEERRHSMQELWAMRQAELNAQKDEAERLVLAAPFDGMLTDLDPELAVGGWVGPRQQLALLLGTGEWQAEVLVDQKSVQRIKRGARAIFYPEGSRLTPLAGTVVDIDSARTTQLSHPLLSASHGGSIAVMPDPKGMTPRDTLYRVHLQLSDIPEVVRIIRGESMIEGQPESWLINVLKPILIVLIRELSF